MKRFAYLAMSVLMPMTSFAQNQYSFDDEVNAELDKMYQGSSSRGVLAQTQSQSSPQVQVNVTPTQTASVSNTTQASQVAPVAQQQQVAQAPAIVVQKQPTTMIEASPLQESKAELLRKSRQDAEVSTEQKIVEKLELSRLEDEKRRSEALFGDKLNQQKQEQVAVPAVIPVVIAEPQAVQVVAPVIKKEEAAVLDRDAVRSEVRASLAEMKEKEDSDKNKFERKTYVAGLAGMGEYPDIANVRGNYSLGFAVGQRINERVQLEGSFLYSNFDVEQRDGGFDWTTGLYYPRITGMDQYQTAVVGKYAFLDGAIRPVIGGALAYTYRTFSDKQFGSSSNNAQSHSLDVGLVTGLDMAVSEAFTIGLDVRYMWNLTSRTQNSGFQRSFSQSVYGSDTPVEQLSHMNISLVGRATF